MNLPDFVTHYFESDYGPFRNVSDLSEAELQILIERERGAETAFNRYAIGADFFRCRKAADDMLVELYRRKFGKAPEGRPYFCVLGRFDKTLTMYREGRSIRMPLNAFSEHQITFMYPDHFHLVAYFDLDAPRFCYQLPANWREQDFWGRLFTYQELCDSYAGMGIDRMIEAWSSKGGWAGAYVEGQIWDRSLRRNYSARDGA